MFAAPRNLLKSPANRGVLHFRLGLLRSFASPCRWLLCRILCRASRLAVPTNRPLEMSVRDLQIMLGRDGLAVTDPRAYHGSGGGLLHIPFTDGLTQLRVSSLIGCTVINDIQAAQPDRESPALAHDTMFHVHQ